MPWPDIFFKAKKRPDSEAPVPPPMPPAEAPKIVEPPPFPTPTKPPPTNQAPRPTIQPLSGIALKLPSKSERSTRTIPVVHGVILRPPARSATGRLTIPKPAAEPMKNIEQLMTEADPVKTLSQTGSVRMLKRLSPEAPALRAPGTPLPIRAEDLPSPAAPVASAPAPVADAPVIIPPKATAIASPWPSFAAKDSTPAVDADQTEPIPPVQIKKGEPIAVVEAKAPGTPVVTAPPAIAPTPAATPLHQPRPVSMESTFLARPTAVSPAPVGTRPPPPALPPMIPIGSIAKRKAKLADVARIILPPKREETGPLPQVPVSAPAGTLPTSSLPAFPVSSMTTRIIPKLPMKLVLPQPFSSPVSESPFMERVTASAPLPIVSAPAIEAKQDAPVAPVAPRPELEPKPVEAKVVEPEIPKAPEPFVPLPVETPVAEVKPEALAPVETPKPEAFVETVVPPAFDFVPKTDFEAPKLDPSLIFDPTTMPEITQAPAATVTAPPAFESVPQLDPEAHTPTPAAPEVLPKLDPEAHKAPPPVSAPTASTEIESAPAPGTREFHLTNGERVAGVVLSETPDTLYIDHPSLGVLTVPRDEIATRLAEIILINGDRIVGNIMAETADMLYVRHSSLGMLTVPKAQRSRRVVEAILKNGDRILGEVLTETETFTVIKSATLGTVTVPHNKVSMLNRKIEQIEMKALPAPGRAEVGGA